MIAKKKFKKTWKLVHSESTTSGLGLTLDPGFFGSTCMDMLPKIRHFSLAYKSNQRYIAYLEVSESSLFYLLYSYLSQAKIFSRGVIMVKYRLKAESQASNAVLSCPDFTEQSIEVYYINIYLIKLENNIFWFNRHLKKNLKNWTKNIWIWYWTIS